MNSLIESDNDSVKSAVPAREGLNGTLGVLQIASIVIAFSAPLAVVAGFLAVVIALGNGLGAPMTFAAAGLVLLLFAIGFAELVKVLPASGGFYVYITAGLGRPLGLACSLIALLSYFLLAAGTYAFFGLAASRFIAQSIGGPVLPWWTFVMGAWLLSTFLSYRELSASAKVLAVTIALEFALMLSFDAAVLLRGGPEGYSLVPFTPAAMISGAPGIAMLFAAACFLGFESTAVYRHEARQPEKTIPRAMFLTVIFMTLFYAFTTYLLITSVGASHAVSISSAGPAEMFGLALQNELGSAAVAAGYLLLCSSIYGAVLSMHNVLARYVFKFATHGLFPTRLGHIHSRYKSPSAASVTAALILALLIAPFAILGTSADLLYARLVGVGAFGLIMLLFLTSTAVAAYFWRADVRVGSLQSTVAPVIAGVCLLLVFILANTNFVALTGTSATTASAILIAIYGIVLGGLGWALWLRTNRPHIYAQIGAE